MAAACVRRGDGAGGNQVFFIFTQLEIRFCFARCLILSCESERGSGGRSCSRLRRGGGAAPRAPPARGKRLPSAGHQAEQQQWELGEGVTESFPTAHQLLLPNKCSSSSILR